MTRARWLAVIGVIVIAALLAFPLREAVHQLIVIPLAYLLWLLDLLYLSLDQGFWWIGVVLVVLFILGKSIFPELKPFKRTVILPRPSSGPVQSLTSSMNKSQSGVYFKWLVANRLGKLAYQILLQRENGKPRSVFAPLVGEGWEARPGLQQYLEKGLHGSFADFPNTGGYFVRLERTPLDHDVTEVIEFLESQIDNSPQKPWDTEKRST